MELAPTEEGLWFKFMAMRNGVSCRTTPIFEAFISWVTQINQNNAQDNLYTNEIAFNKQFENLLTKYGYNKYSFDVCDTTAERVIPKLYTESVEKWVLFLKHKYAYELALQKLKQGDKLLEIGCGDGYGAALLSSTGEDIVAIDIDRPSIDYAKRKYYKDNIHFDYYDGKTINHPDHSF